MDPVLQRAMFSGQAPQVPQAAGTGITSGLETTPEQEAEMEGTLAEIAGGLQSMNDDIDNAEDYVGIMNAIRGDDQSIEERRSELAGYIGKEDAGKTPESALTLIQPSLTLLDSAEQGSQEEGGAIADDGIMSMLGELGSQGAMQGAADAMQGGQPMQAPRQREAMTRMAMGEQPVMRFNGSPQSGEGYESSDYQIQDLTKMNLILPGTAIPSDKGTPSGKMGILEKLLGNVPKAKTTAELLPQYQELYKDSAKAYELNPYIAGLQLAGAIANAPKGGLLTSILAPETIKAVSDPILQMAQAKGQGDLLAKKAAMEAATASRSAETKAKQAINVAAIPKLLDQEALITKDIGGTTYIIDPAALRAATAAGQSYTPSTLKGETAANIQVRPIGDTGQYFTWDQNDKSGTITTGGTAKTEWIKTETKSGDVIMYDKSNPKNYETIIEGGGQILGDITKGFVKLKDGVATPISIKNADGSDFVYKGDQTELMKNSERFGELSGKQNLDAGETAELQALTQALVPEATKGEFQTMLDEYLVGYKSRLESGLPAGSDQSVDQMVNDVKQNLIKDYITAKTTKPGTVFDPNLSINKYSSESIIKQLNATRDGAALATQLAGRARTIVTTTDKFEGGKLGSQRLAISQLAKEFGLTEFLRDKFNIEGSLEQFLGGDADIGQVQQALGNQMVVELAGSFPGNLNQTEIQILENAALGIGKTPGANKLLAAALDNIADRQSKIAAGLQAYAEENKDLSQFELKIGLDRKQIELEGNLNDPEKNPSLKALNDQLASFDPDATVQLPDTVGALAGSITTVNDVDNSYSALQAKFGVSVFPNLPTDQNQRKIALQRVVDFIKDEAD